MNNICVLFTLLKDGNLNLTNDRMALIPLTFKRSFFKLLPFLILSFILVNSSLAQDRCATFINHPKNKHQNEALFENWLKQKSTLRRQNQAQNRTQGATYRIPVVVHVIHNGESIGTGTNISDAQVLSQIDVLNKDFQRLNSDASSTPAEFVDVAGSVDIEFVLAKQAPDGSPTNGIVRVQGSQSAWTFSDYDQLRSESYWNADDYMNVWVANITDYIGYSQFPISDKVPGLEDSFDNPWTDGVIVYYRSFGSDDDGAFNLDSRYNKGRTLTHEMGHFFGLRHIWGDQNDCNGTDYVDDTPAQNGSTGGCPIGSKTSCNNTHKMYQNYLDYTNDECMNLFTAGQVERMVTILDYSIRRNSLLSSHGLDDPAPVNDDLGISLVNAPKVISCNSITPSVEIKNYGLNPITSAQIQLSINDLIIETLDLTPNLSPFETAVVEFTTRSLNSGASKFTFEILQTNGTTDGNTANNQVTANTYNFEQNSSSTTLIPLREKFETAFDGEWKIINHLNGNNWQTVSTNFNSSAIFESFTDTKLGDEAWLISPSLDLSKTDKASMFFDLSYALNKSRLTSERLRIYASLDCGNVFNILLYDKAGDKLSEWSSPTGWAPASDTSWTREFVNLTSLTGNADVRLGFVITNGHGNNLYIDNIEFYNADDPIQPTVNDPFFIYYDAQRESDFLVKFNFPEQQNVDVNVVDTMGRSIYHNAFQNILNETLSLQLSNVSSGVYIIQFRTQQHLHASRVFISK
jgi:hypothetical protein